MKNPQIHIRERIGNVIVFYLYENDETYYWLQKVFENLKEHGWSRADVADALEIMYEAFTGTTNYSGVVLEGDSAALILLYDELDAYTIRVYAVLIDRVWEKPIVEALYFEADRR